MRWVRAAWLGAWCSLRVGQCQPLVDVALDGTRMTFSRPDLPGSPVDDRTVGCYISGFTSVELAESLHLTPDGVRTRLKRILDRLRKELRDG